MKTVIASRSRAVTLALTLAFVQAAAWPASAAPGNATGPSALALAAVVASYSSVLGSYDRRTMARLFGGHTANGFPPNRKISVTADSIMCRVSDVDLTARSCELVFKGGAKRSLAGRAANELYATLAVAGVMAEGAAGSLIESITKLDCTIDPTMVNQKNGGGADCTWQ
jgi:hypothetical protein